MPAVIGAQGTGENGDHTFHNLTITNQLTLSSFTQGSVLFAGPGGLVSQDNPFFFYDNTNNVVCIGTNTSDIVSSYPSLKVVSSASGISAAFSGFTDSNTIAFTQANGTEGSPTAVTDDQVIGGFISLGHDGSGYVASGSIASIAQSPIS